MKYKVRSKIYSNSSGTLTFNPETNEGRSYQWYSIVRQFGNLVVLNTYNYSPTTSMHIIKTRKLLNSLIDMKFVSIEAPKGLQDLDSSLKHVMYSYAAAVLKNKHARIKDEYEIARYVEQLKILTVLGKNASSDDMKKAEADALSSRQYRLAFKKKQRDEKQLKKAA